MKKCNILMIGLAYAIVSSGLLYASPKSITVINMSGEDINARIMIGVYGRLFKYHDMFSVGDNKSLEYTDNSNTGIDVIEILNSTLDLKQYSEPITIVYDGEKLLEQSVYNLENQSSAFSQKISALKQRIAANLAVAWSLGGAFFKRMRTAWQNRSRATSELSFLAQARIYNLLDTNIAFSAGNIQSRKPKTITPQQSETFGLKNNNLVYIYKPEDTKNPIKIIDLQKYINNPKSNSELQIYLQKRYDVANKLFGWMPRWSDFTYQVKWVEEEPYAVED